MISAFNCGFMKFEKLHTNLNTSLLHAACLTYGHAARHDNFPRQKIRKHSPQESVFFNALSNSLDRIISLTKYMKKILMD